MAEALGVVGAVASIAQLIDFSASIVYKSRRIRKSANGALVENTDIEVATKQLSDMTSALRNSLKPLFQHAPITQDDQALHNLCQGCIVVAAELIAALEKLKLKGKSRAFTSLRKALKSVRSKDEIESMQKRLEVYQKVLDTTILVSLRSKLTAAEIDRLRAKDDLDHHTAEILKALTSSTAGIRSSIRDHMVILEDVREQNLTIAEAYACQHSMEHENIRSEISGLSFSLEQQNAVTAAGVADTQDIVEYAREQNLIEHERTRLELASRITRAEDYIRSLEQQIQRMEQVVKDGIAEFVRRAPTMNPREQQTLKEITNAKFSLWTALQVLLERLKAFVVMLKTSASDERWSTSAIANAWKLIPYPFLSEQLGDVERPDCVIEQVESAEEVSRIATLAMLCYPIAAGDAKEVEIAINRGVEVNQRLPVKEFNGMTPLMFAITTAYGLTAFDSIQTILPMRRDVRKVIQLLLAHGADPCGVDAEGRDAVHVARNPQYFLMSKDRGNLPIDWTLEQLVEQSPDADVHHLMTLADIVWDGNLMQLRKMLQDVPEICSLADDYRASVLGIAAYRGIEEAARLILEAGASPDGPDPIGSTPLAIAVAMNRLAMVDLLLQHGAELDSIDPFLGLNPLEYAAREGNEAVCRVFLKHILHKPNAALGEILSKSLCLAVRHYQTTTVELLLDNGADVHTNIGMYLAAWEIEAYHGANFGQRIDRMTPRTYVENKIRNRLVPLHLELASETLLKSLEAREKQTGDLNNHAKPDDSFERLINVSARYHLNPKRSSFLFSSRPASPGVDSSTAVAA